MFENIVKLYRAYGGIWAILSSYYFWIAFLCALVSYKSAINKSWIELNIGIMPSLTGFTIASFAIVFAILGPDLVKTLLSRSGKGSSPITVVAASLGHAIMIQVFSIIVALLSRTADLGELLYIFDKILKCFGIEFDLLRFFTNFVALPFSFLGLILMYYGVFLVLAAILSIFRMQLIVDGVNKRKSDSTAE